MYIKKLTIEHFGEFENQSFNFDKDLCVLAGDKKSEVFAALCVVLQNRLLRFQMTQYCFSPESKIYAELIVDNKTYSVNAIYDENAPDHCAVFTYHNGVLVTEEEMSLVFGTSIEEEECSYFINRYDYYRYVPFAELDCSKKLAYYQRALAEEERKEFSERTDGIGLTYTFRKILKNFCNEFLPQQFRIEKRLCLTMDEEGFFLAKDVLPRRDLSMTEEMIFQFLCFLNVNRFWKEVKKELGRTTEKPLFLFDLSYYMDDAISVKKYLDEMLSLNRQVFLFTDNK